MVDSVRCEDRGRQRLDVDCALVLHLRDDLDLGWLRIAQEYRQLTGQYISKETIKRRYFNTKSKD